MLQPGTICKIKGPEPDSKTRYPQECKNWDLNKDWLSELTVAVKQPTKKDTCIVKILDLGRYNGRKFRYGSIELPVEFLKPLPKKQALDMGDEWEFNINEMTGEKTIQPKGKR